MYVLLCNAVCFRPPEITASFSDEPVAQALTSGDSEKIPTTPLHLASSSSLITTQLLPNVSSITYHPNPLIVSPSFFVLLFLNKLAATSNFVFELQVDLVARDLFNKIQFPSCAYRFFKCSFVNHCLFKFV